MHDINNELRAAYFSLISGNILINGAPVPYYYSQVPKTATPPNPDYYILLNTIYSTNTNDDTKSQLTLIIQFMIVTKTLQNNAGAIKDSIANQLYQIVFPYPSTMAVQIVSGYIFDTKMQNDIEQTGLSDGEKNVVNRIISFRHLIKLDPGGSGGATTIYYGVQSTNADPVDFSNVLNQDASIPISIDYGAQSSPQFYWLAVLDTFAQKTNWADLNDTGNAGDIGGDTDLFGVRSLIIGSSSYNLYMTRYLTGFNEPSAQVRYS